MSLGFLFLPLLPGKALAGPNDGLPPAETPPDLSTPRRAVAHFVELASDGQYVEAARALDLRRYARDDHPSAGAWLAERLYAVTEGRAALDLGAISDEPQGTRGDGASVERIGVLGTGHGVPLELRRVVLRDGSTGWVFSQRTVAAIPELYADYGPGWLAERAPAQLRGERWLGLQAWQWLGVLVAIAIALAIGVLLTSLLGMTVRRVSRRMQWKATERLVQLLRAPVRVLLALVPLGALVQPLNLGEDAGGWLGRAFGLFAVVVVGVVIVRAIDWFAYVLEQRAAESGDGARTRGVRTQVLLLRRVLTAVGVVVLCAVALMQFEAVRNLGVSLLASAGVAGVVVGIAAQRTLGNLLAGIQLSFAQPLRIGDVVVIDGHYGTVEEVNLTFCVLRAADRRRVILPTPKILDTTFENWTRVPDAIVGIVLVPVDQRLPVPAFREAMEHYVRAHPLFDGKTVSVTVVDATERTMTVRIVASAKDPDASWDLRCAVREAAFAWLAEHQSGRFLPSVRVTSDDEDAAVADTSG